MDDFAAQPGTPNMFGLVQGEANAVQPGKRMLSAMSPTIVLDREGKVLLVVGAAGGPTIITAVAQVILNVIEHGMPLADAMRAPRMHHQSLPDQLRLESAGFSEATLAQLKAMGHSIALQIWDRERERDHAGPLGVARREGAARLRPRGRLLSHDEAPPRCGRSSGSSHGSAPIEWRFTVGLISVVISTALSSLIPTLLRRAIDRLGQPDPWIPVLEIAGLMLAVTLTMAIFRFTMREILNGVSRVIENDLRDALFARLTTLDGAWFGRMRTGEIMARLTNDLTAVRMAVGPAVMYLTNTIFGGLFALGFMIAISPRLNRPRSDPDVPPPRRDVPTGQGDPRSIRTRPVHLRRSHDPRPGASRRDLASCAPMHRSRPSAPGSPS